LEEKKVHGKPVCTQLLEAYFALQNRIAAPASLPGAHGVLNAGRVAIACTA